MHGRQKVQGSPEEEAKKQEERQKKLLAYRTAMSKVFTKRKNQEYDDEILGISSKVLLSNPDISTLWNIRKETLSAYKQRDEAVFKAVVPSELQLVEGCLRQNPKSYGAWHHRCWIMKETEFETVDDEIKLCTKYLKYDDRNFHCWDYRKFLVDHSAKLNAKDELDFTTEKIQSNFSNYSSWHLRSNILPQISKDFLKDELNLIKNAAFTDPNDQSVWFYHKWLVNTHLQNVSPRLIYAGYFDSVVHFLFNVNVPCPSDAPFNLGVSFNGNIVPIGKQNWSNPWKIPKCKLWMLDTKSCETVLPSIYLSHNEALGIKSCEIKDRSYVHFMEEEEKQKVMLTIKFLKQEKAWIEELYEIEPDNKWLILSLIHLLRLVDFEANKEQIFSMIEKLQRLDGMRFNYYTELKTKFELECRLKQELQLNECILSHILPSF